MRKTIILFAIAAACHPLPLMAQIPGSVPPVVSASTEVKIVPAAQDGITKRMASRQLSVLGTRNVIYAVSMGSTVVPITHDQFTGHSGAISNGLAQTGIGYFGAVNPSNLSSNWVETMRPYSVSIAEGASVTTKGLIGFVQASRSSDNRCAGGCMGSIGAESLEYNDNTSYIQTGYGHYVEADRAAGAGSTLGLETDVANYGSIVDINPLGIGGTGITPAYWSACGGGHTGVNACTAAYVALANGAQFRKGLVFIHTAVTTRSDGKMEDISIPQKGAVSFYDNAGNIIGNVYSGTTNIGRTGLNLNFQPGKAVLETLAGSPVLTINQSSVTLAPTTFATLPLCSDGKGVGTQAYIIDAPVAITALHQQVRAGGGRQAAFVGCNGSGWFVYNY